MFFGFLAPRVCTSMKLSSLFMEFTLFLFSDWFTISFEWFDVFRLIIVPSSDISG